jgi:hypothetical protein
MEETDRPIISSFEPEHDDDSESIPRVRLDGWIKITFPGGRTQVLKVQTVKVLERVSLEVLYPEERQGYPVYESGFLWARIARIPEGEAIAWLQKRGKSVPRAVPMQEPGEDSEGLQ